jgi:hypothetical protein
VVAAAGQLSDPSMRSVPLDIRSVDGVLSTGADGAEITFGSFLTQQLSTQFSTGRNQIPVTATYENGTITFTSRLPPPTQEINF